MRFIFYLLAIIFFLIWIPIGGMVLVTLTKVNPSQLLGQTIGGGAVGSGTAGFLQGLGIWESLNKLSTSGAKGLYDSLTPEKQACVRKAWGDQTLAAVLAGTQPLNSDLVSKVIGCLPNK